MTSKRDSRFVAGASMSIEDYAQWVIWYYFYSGAFLRFQGVLSAVQDSFFAVMPYMAPLRTTGISLIIIMLSTGHCNQ